MSTANDGMGRAKSLMRQVMKTWNPPFLHGQERPADIAQTSVMLAIAFIFGRECLPELTPNQQLAIDCGLQLLQQTLESGDTDEPIGCWVHIPEQPTLSQWMEQWEAAIESGQSRISREEAEKRYERLYGHERE